MQRKTVRCGHPGCRVPASWCWGPPRLNALTLGVDDPFPTCGNHEEDKEREKWALTPIRTTFRDKGTKCITHLGEEKTP